jgi:hypothetical protein
MKLKSTFLLLMFIPVLVYGDFRINKPLKSSEQGLPGLALSVNPLGAAFFGPTIDLSLGLNSNTLIYVNSRFTSLGYMTHKVKQKRVDEDLGSLSGIGFGAGISRFVSEAGTGVYYGGQVGFDKLHSTYSVGEDWEWYEDVNSYIFGLNAGYRIALGSKFYMNAGGFLGGVYSDFTWEYDDEVYGLVDDSDRDGTTFFLIGMAELAFGIRLR